MDWLPAGFAVCVMAVGWFYLFSSKAASRLGAVEVATDNQRRSRLRRLGGAVMVLLGILVYVGYYAVDLDRPDYGFVIVWSAVCILMMLVVLLALIDLRLTWKLRHPKRRMDSQ